MLPIVNEEWMYELVKQGKILQRHFPNIGLPCPKCGENLTDGVSLYQGCKRKLVRGLDEIKATEERDAIKYEAAYLKNHE